MDIRIIDARKHNVAQYRDYYDGYKALQLIDDAGCVRGELVWRLATGHTVEITEFGIYDEADRRQGWGTKLLDAGIASMRSFFAERKLRFRRVYLFCDAINDAGRAFYEARGFTCQAILKDFCHYCDATLYVLSVEPGASPAGPCVP